MPPDPATGGDVESIQELLVKQEAADEADADEKEAVVALTKERLAADPAEIQGRPDAGDRVRLQAVLPGETPEPAGRQEADAVPRLRLTARPALPLALLIAAASGALLSMAFPPVGAWPVAFVALAPLLWLLAGHGPRRGFVLGLAYGLAFHGATLYWILRFGEMAWVALTLVSALWVALFGALVRLCAGRDGR